MDSRLRNAASAQFHSDDRGCAHGHIADLGAVRRRGCVLDQRTGRGRRVEHLDRAHHAGAHSPALLRHPQQALPGGDPCWTHRGGSDSQSDARHPMGTHWICRAFHRRRHRARAEHSLSRPPTRSGGVARTQVNPAVALPFELLAPHRCAVGRAHDRHADRGATGAAVPQSVPDQTTRCIAAAVCRADRNELCGQESRASVSRLVRQASRCAQSACVGRDRYGGDDHALDLRRLDAGDVRDPSGERHRARRVGTRDFPAAPRDDSVGGTHEHHERVLLSQLAGHGRRRADRCMDPRQRANP